MFVKQTKQPNHLLRLALCRRIARSLFCGHSGPQRFFLPSPV